MDREVLEKLGLAYLIQHANEEDAAKKEKYYFSGESLKNLFLVEPGMYREKKSKKVIVLVGINRHVIPGKESAHKTPFFKNGKNREGCIVYYAFENFDLQKFSKAYEFIPSKTKKTNFTKSLT